MFIYRIQRYVSSYITLFDHIDAIVFSGGIGERNKDIRNLIMSNSHFKKIKVIIVPCDEEKNMAVSLKKK
jgi:acetate kinase